MIEIFSLYTSNLKKKPYLNPTMTSPFHHLNWFIGAYCAHCSKFTSNWTTKRKIQDGFRVPKSFTLCIQDIICMLQSIYLISQHIFGRVPSTRRERTWGQWPTFGKTMKSSTVSNCPYAFPKATGSQGSFSPHAINVGTWEAKWMPVSFLFHKIR